MAFVSRTEEAAAVEGPAGAKDVAGSPGALERDAAAVRYVNGRREEVSDRVAAEAVLHLSINGEKVVSLLCSPTQIEDLAAGFALTSGLIDSPAEIRDVIRLDGTRVDLRLRDEGRDVSSLLARKVFTTGCGIGMILEDVLDRPGADPMGNGVRLRPDDILRLMADLHRRSRTFKDTGGTHSAAAYDPANGGLVAFAEDLGRHNAVDKVIGAAIRRGVDLGRAVLVSSGRVSSEVLLKAARARCPVLVTKSAPTDLAAEIAQAAGITLVAFTRSRKFSIYAHPERVQGL
ncbi:MAG: formate dehydrogenase accessory sulfurtransferase FdhD [Nitrospirae bacterium]|nr:formate dehydrogenase accessory sulfurtransferase FdhD [Nitrospirota bacterium]